MELFSFKSENDAFQIVSPGGGKVHSEADEIVGGSLCAAARELMAMFHQCLSEPPPSSFIEMEITTLP